MVSQILGSRTWCWDNSWGASCTRYDRIGKCSRNSNCPLYFGSAVVALLIGASSQRFGRRAGLAGGFLIGGLGAIGVIIAALINSVAYYLFPFLFMEQVWLLIFKFGMLGQTLQMRNNGQLFASMALVSTTLGAVVGPNLVNTMGNLQIQLVFPI